MQRIGQALALGLLVLATATGAWAQDTRVEELQQTVEALKNRLRDTERRLAEIEGRNQAGLTREDVMAILAELEAEPGPGDPWDMRVFWKNGLNFATANEAVTAKIGGRVYIDYGCLAGGDLQDAPFNTDLEGGAEIRTARLNFEADLHDVLKIKMEYDFAPSDSTPKDVYLQFKKIPALGALTIGHFKEPFGLEELTSSRYITFMERSLASTLVPGRNLGAAITGAFAEKRATYAAGIFRPDQGDPGDITADSGYAATGRLTWAPIYQDNGRRVVHLGAAYSWRNTGDDTVRYRQRPEFHLFDTRFTDTGAFVADDVQLAGAEFAWVEGPFSLQSEYIGAVADVAGGGTACLSGFYVQASYFLTGEHRNYKLGSGAFDRIKVLRPYGIDGGWGAWEVAARYSYVDLDDAAVAGAGLGANDVQAMSLGLNWYLNSNVRLMWNYIHNCIDGATDDASVDIFAMRVQFDW